MPDWFALVGSPRSWLLNSKKLRFVIVHHFCLSEHWEKVKAQPKQPAIIEQSFAILRTLHVIQFKLCNMMLKPYQSLAANTRLFPLARPHDQGHFSSVFAFSCKGSVSQLVAHVGTFMQARKNKLNKPKNKQWMYIFHTAHTHTTLKDPYAHVWKQTNIEPWRERTELERAYTRAKQRK